MSNSPWPQQPHAASVSEIEALLEVTTHGLSVQEAERRLQSHGANTLPQAPSVTWWQVALHQFRSPLIYLLLVAGVVALALNETADAIFIFAVLLINALIGTIQEYGAERSADALSSLVPARTRVRRDGVEREIAVADVALGDLVVVDAGARVPADLRLISAAGVAADESMLTGESMAVSKVADAVVAADAPVGDRETMLFAGTLLTRGRALGYTVGTGLHTQVGAIATSMQATRMVRPPLLVRMDTFARTVAMAVLGVCILVAAIGGARSMDTSDIFFACVALAVSAIPEGLPVGLTVALSIATRRMSRRNVIARRLVAVEALGSCTFIASDKTGTLTLNELTVTELMLADGSTVHVEGVGLAPEGRVLSTPEMSESARESCAALIRAAVMCNDAVLANAPEDGAWHHQGDAVDVSLLVLGEKHDPSQARAWRERPEHASIPFDPELRWAASIRASSDGTHKIFVKGAPEQILEMSTSSAEDSAAIGVNVAAQLDRAVRLAEQGFRVLAFADATIERLEHPFKPEDVAGLRFLGFAAMIDPLRPEAADAVAKCHQAGIEVAMVTGDHPVTALAISRQLGIAGADARVVTGAMLREAEAISEDAVRDIVRGATVFARVEPAQKLQIVQTLGTLGHFVAVTGDGANDAPALRAGHVGVAMAARGTDVAREASTLIITDDNFASIVAGIEEGRVAYGNVRKVTFLLVATGATEVVLFLAALAVGMPLPLLPAQLLWLNLVTNGIQDVALAFEPGEGGEMRRPPRSPKERIFNRTMIERVAVISLTMGTLSTIAFHLFLSLGWTLEESRSALLLMFVLFENVLVGAARSETRSVLTLNPLRNRVLLAGTLTAFGLHVFAMYWGPLQSLLSIGPVPAWKWAIAAGTALVPFTMLELHGWMRRRSA